MESSADYSGVLVLTFVGLFAWITCGKKVTSFIYGHPLGISVTFVVCFVLGGGFWAIAIFATIASALPTNDPLPRHLNTISFLLGLVPLLVAAAILTAGRFRPEEK